MVHFKEDYYTSSMLLYIFLYLFFILNEKKTQNVLKQKFEPELISVINLSGPSRKNGLSEDHVHVLRFL